MEKGVQVAPAALAREVGVVCRRDEAHSLRGAGEHVADVVRECLQFVRLELYLIMHDVVVRRPRGTLQATVRCGKKKKEICG